MGGIGSGNRYRWGKKDTVEDCRSLTYGDGSGMGFLRRGGGWQWRRGGGTVANIAIGVAAGCVFLSYRSQRKDGEWK